MFVHIFLFRWRDGVSEEEKVRAQSEIEAFEGIIPGLLQVAAGKNCSASGQGFGFGGVMHFTDMAAYEAYAVHPAHARLLDWLVPLIDAVECDFPWQQK